MTNDGSLFYNPYDPQSFVDYPTIENLMIEKYKEKAEAEGDLFFNPILFKPTPKLF